MHDFALLIDVWYRQNKRNLPWRHTKNPYYIWLSEVILQQTRVDQGLSYYLKFVATFPTVHDLANADEGEVLKLWQGLGYYSRARNLHTAAKEVVEKYDGQFPNSYRTIKSLKGIGDYTAAAIASFAFDLPHAVVDGNVFRVLSRYFNDNTPIDSAHGKKLFTSYAEELLNKKDPAGFNQAIMELGALVCTPKNTKCDECPLCDTCQGFRTQHVYDLPVKSKKTKTRNRYFHYIYSETEILLQKREEKDIWTNMYEFPLLEIDTIIEPKKVKEEIKIQLRFDVAKEPIAAYKHILSHQHIYATFWKLNSTTNLANTPYIKCSQKELEGFAIPRLIDKFLEEHG
jgi:A/G-specific adenine glycosylase